MSSLQLNAGVSEIGVGLKRSAEEEDPFTVSQGASAVIMMGSEGAGQNLLTSSRLGSLVG